MSRVLALVAACAPVLMAGAQAQVADNETLGVGDQREFDLAGRDAVSLRLDAAGTVRVVVENRGRDTILTILDADGSRKVRAAAWRGPEHYYAATLDVSQPVTLVVEPDDPISPPGRFLLRVEPAPGNESLLAAERAMTAAVDRYLGFYYGEGDTRSAALQGYLDAATRFANGGDIPRAADALFEAANVSDDLCVFDQTMSLLRSAQGLWQEIGDERGVATAENLRGEFHRKVGELDAATRLLESAAGRRRNLQERTPSDDYFYAESVNNLGLVHRERGDARLAAQYFRDALEHWQGDIDMLSIEPTDQGWTDTSDRPWLHHSLTAMNNLGWANELFGDIQEAQRIWQQALSLSRFQKIGFTAATLQNNLGNLNRRLGRMDAAMDLLEQALNFFTVAAPDNYWASLVHFNIAQVHRDIGDSTRALGSLQQALALRTPQCDPVGRAETLREIAAIELAAGRIDDALHYVAEANLLLTPFDGNELTRASLVDLAGQAQLAKQDYRASLENHERAIQLYRGGGDQHGELRARINRALANLAIGRTLAAIPELEISLQIAGQLEARIEGFRVQTLLGRARLVDNDTTAAIADAQAAIDVSEQIRSQLIRPILLRDFAAIQRDAFDVLVRAYLSQGNTAEAWHVADTARARRFVDVISRADIDLGALTDEQSQRYEYLLSAIALRVETRTDFLARGDADSAGVVLRELLSLIDELDLLQARARPPAADARSPMSLEALQAQLTSDEVVLEYYLGDLVSGVFVIRANSVAFKALPRLEDIRSKVAGVLGGIRDVRTLPRDSLVELSRSLIEVNETVENPAASLIVVPDGPLHYVPFAALLDPASDYTSALITRRRISYLPSIAALRALTDQSPETATGIAVLADPVFQRDDERVSSAGDVTTVNAVASLEPILARSLERSGVTELPRLPGTLLEARAIEDAAGDLPVLKLEGTDASRDAVLSGRLNGYRILHFATHGILDDEEPALSGLVLSGFSEDGADRNRFLRSQEIAGLNLDARLVVLSGCRTGLGRPVHGEGLLGLSRAFFYAGANQVVSTLWQVPDRATAELMRHFYDGLLRRELSAPEALRQAQLALANDARWQNPYYWAAFILQGDWQ